MNEADYEGMARAWAPVIKEYVQTKAPKIDYDRVAGELFKAIDKRLEPILTRIATLEATGIKYCGVWQRAQDYKKGDVVTDGGAAWIALKNIEGVRPGDGADWQLMVQKGRDGKDAR